MRIAIFITGLLIAITGSAVAQVPPIPPIYPGIPYALPPQEVVAAVRSKGFEPLSRPHRQGPFYALRAIDPAGQEARVIVDAGTGRVLKVLPLARHGLLPAPPLREPGRVSDGYRPNSRITPYPPELDGQAVHGAAPAAPKPLSAAPLPHPRPKVFADAVSTPPGASGDNSQAAPAAPEWLE
jgi:hypothetical protein